MNKTRQQLADRLKRLNDPPVRDARKESWFSELHSLLASGLDFSRSFQLLIQSEGDEKIRRIMQRIYEQVVSGSSLWQAFEASGRFTALDCGVIRIGEETGRLEDSLLFLTDYYHKKVEQRRMISSSVSYPAIILVVAVIVVIFMMLVIVPMFEQVYSRMGGELPAITQWIIAASQRFPQIFVVFGTIVLMIIALLVVFKERTAVRSGLASVMLNLPLAGKIIRKNQQAHFCKLLYLLTSSGVPLLYGLEMLGSIITFYPYQVSFGQICLALRRGELFSINLERYPKLYGKKLTTLLRVGEETNRLPDMLRKQGEDLTKELEYSLKQLGNMLEPILILFVGVLVAIILISMYLPMFKLGGIMG